MTLLTTQALAALGDNWRRSGSRGPVGPWVCPLSWGHRAKARQVRHPESAARAGLNCGDIPSQTPVVPPTRGNACWWRIGRNGLEYGNNPQGGTIRSEAPTSPSPGDTGNVHRLSGLAVGRHNAPVGSRYSRSTPQGEWPHRTRAPLVASCACGRGAHVR